MSSHVVDTLAVYGANYLYIFLLALALVWYLWQPIEAKLEMIAWGIVALPVMYILLTVAGMIYSDPRPFVVGHFDPLIPHEANNGFPSDHTMICAATSSIVFFYSKKMSALLWALTALVGASRVWVGVHHTTDIIGSAVIAATVALLTWIFVLPMLKKTERYRQVSHFAANKFSRGL